MKKSLLDAAMRRCGLASDKNEKKAKEEEKLEASRLQNPTVGDASDFYWACRRGDVDVVTQSMSIYPFAELNRVEANGSTGLHAASYFGQTSVVQLLLHEYGVVRHRLNRHGVTAYREAQNDEIRQLFFRPSNAAHRFCNDQNPFASTIITSIQPSSHNGGHAESEDSFSDESENITKNNQKTQSKEIASAKDLSQSSLVEPLAMLSTGSRNIFRKPKKNDERVRWKEHIATLQQLLAVHLTPSHRDFRKASQLLIKYLNTRNPELLLRLYTLETPLYNCLKTDEKLSLMYCHLLKHEISVLERRFFQGQTFRGVTMEHQDLTFYKWISEHSDYNFLTTMSFTSTSKDRSVAERFSAAADQHENAFVNVMMILDFPLQTELAIDLNAIPSKGCVCVSDFEHESEVLVFPSATFRIKNIRSATGTETDVNNPRGTIEIEFEHIFCLQLSPRTAAKRQYDSYQVYKQAQNECKTMVPESDSDWDSDN